MLEQALFMECSKYWWANLLLVGNFIPWDQNAKGGCMPWSWVIAVDFQLYLFIPFYVMAYKKSKNFGLAIGWFLLVAGTVIICAIVSEFDLTAGAYTLENWYMYAQYLNKPYCKLQVHAIGLLSAILYLDILEYRKARAESLEEAQKQYPKIHFVTESWLAGKVMLLLGVVFFVINLFISFFCTKTPYAWSKTANMAFFSLTRSTYSLGWMLIAFYILFGKTNVGNFALANPAFNGCGRLVYPAYLIAPIVMMIIYSNTDHGVFMTLVGNMTLGMGNMVLAFVFAAIAYMLIQW